MKKAISSLAIIILVIITSCERNNKDVQPSGLKVQEHDHNEMMKLMHAMQSKMDTMTMMHNVDHDFAMMMKIHHQGAIDMSNNELSRGDNAQMRAKANQIITAQTAEIAELDAFLNSHMDMDTTGFFKFNKEMMSSMQKMSQGSDLQVITGDADNDFAALMIVHHQSATDMAHAEIEFGKDTDLKVIAQKMIEDQNAEIKEFQNWLLNNKPY